MLYISEVRGTLKKGCDVKLSPRTVIVGGNSSGKSTIVQTMMLALGGYVSDMEGRDEVKNHKALGRLFDDPLDMRAEVTLVDSREPDDGLQQELEEPPSWQKDGVLTYKWVMQPGKTKGSLKRPFQAAYDSQGQKVEKPPEVRFPLQQLQSTLGGSADTVGSWLSDQVLGPLTVEELVAEMPPELQGDVAAFARRMDTTDMLELGKKVAAEATKFRREATTQEKTAETMLEGVPAPLSEDAVKALLDEQAALRSDAAPAPAPGVTQAEYDRIEDEGRAAAEEYQRLQRDLGDIPEPPPQVAESLAKLKTAKVLIAHHAEKLGVDTCFVCGNVDPSAISRQTTSIVEAERALGGYAAAVQRREGLENRMAALHAQMMSIRQRLDGLTIREDAVTSLPPGRLEEVAQALAEDEAAKRTWKANEAVEKTIAQLRAKADRYAQVGRALKKAGRKRLEAKKAQFEDGVSQFLLGTEELGVDLSVGRVGLIRDEKLHSALGGAEENAVLLALCAYQEDGSTPCVLVPPDRGWDQDTLEGVMEALAESPVQVIIMSTVAPKPMEGWSLVDLTE